MTSIRADHLPDVPLVVRAERKARLRHYCRLCSTHQLARLCNFPGCQQRWSAFLSAQQRSQRPQQKITTALRRCSSAQAMQVPYQPSESFVTSAVGQASEQHRRLPTLIYHRSAQFRVLATCPSSRLDRSGRNSRAPLRIRRRGLACRSN